MLPGFARFVLLDRADEPSARCLHIQRTWARGRSSVRIGRMVADASHAVFLSYASQDAEAARRICEALQSGGIEVFLDRSELRGGDVWDQKIRREILGCTLFIPVISQHTQQR